MTTLKNRWSTQFWVIWAWFPQLWVIAQIWVFTQIWGIPDGFTQIWVMDVVNAWAIISGFWFHSNLSLPLKSEFVTQIWGKAFPSNLSDELRFEWRTQIWVKSKTTYYRPSIEKVIFVVVGNIRIIGDHIQVAIHYLCFFTINAWQFRNCKEGFHHCKLETPSTSWVMFMPSLVSITAVGYHKAFADYQAFKWNFVRLNFSGI